MRTRVAPHFWAVFWNVFTTYALPPMLAWFGWWYQGLLKAQGVSHHLDPLAALFIALPTSVVIGVLLALGICFSLFLRYVIFRRANEPQRAPATNAPLAPAAESDLQYVLKTTRSELDVARAARDSAERQAEAFERVSRALAEERDDALRQAEIAGALSAELDEARARLQLLDERLSSVQAERDAALKEIQTLKRPDAPRTLQQVVFALAKEMRNLVNTVPEGLTLDEECELLFDVVNETIWERYQAAKDRLAVVLPAREVQPPDSMVGTSKDRLRQAATNLEQEALRLPDGVLE
jgi:hypothetical protein